MKTIQLFQVDAFTNEKFKGNPAGVCILNEHLDDETMQNIAAEMNLSETAFLVKKAEGKYDLRWFTPTMEVTICGHATLASAHILWDEGYADEIQTLEFDTKSGVLVAQKHNNTMWLDFPRRDVKSIQPPPVLIEALGATPFWAGQFEDWCLIELDDEDTIADIEPDFEMLKKVDTYVIIITAKSSNPNFDYVTRVFAPRAGIPEDPVTGSATCLLAPHWGKKLKKTELKGKQISKRTGIVSSKVFEKRVHFGGDAVTVFKTEISI